MVTKEDLAQAILELKSSQQKITKELRDSTLELKNSTQELKNSDFRLKSSQEKIDEKTLEVQETLKRVGKMVGNIAQNQGDIAEEFFYNSLAHKPTFAGINYDFIDKNVTRHHKNVQDEYDILMINGKDVAIIETKYKAHVNDVERLITKKYNNFKKLYPEYANYRHHLGLASFNMNEDVKEKALQNNVILLQRKGDLIETILPS